MSDQDKRLIFYCTAGLVFGSWAGQHWGDTIPFLIARISLCTFLLIGLWMGFAKPE